MVEENLACSSWGEKWLWLLAHKTAQYSRLQMIIDQIELMTFAVESFYYLKAYIIVGEMMTGGINHYQPRDWWVVNIPPKMPVDQVKEEEEPAKEVIATKVNLNKLSKPSSSHVHSDFCSKIPRIFANWQVGRVRVDLRSVGERHCEVVQRQVWVRIHQQERHQGRCVRPPGNAILTGQLFLMLILTNLLNQSCIVSDCHHQEQPKEGC